MGKARMPVHAPSSSLYASQPPPLRRIPTIPLPPIEEPSPYVGWSLANDVSALIDAGIGHLIFDREVGALMRTIDWHIALGPQNTSRFDPLLDRRVFVFPNPDHNIASSSTTQTQAGPTILVRVYTPGRTFPASHTSYLSLRLYPHARVRDLFYEISDCLAGRVEDEDKEREARIRVREAQMWRVAQGFTEIGTTSILPRSHLVEGVEEEGEGGQEPIVFADLLNRAWVISDLTPINAPESDGVFSMSVLFKE